MRDKGFDPAAVRGLIETSNEFSGLFTRLVLRTSSFAIQGLIEEVMDYDYDPSDIISGASFPYTGSVRENAAIDQSIKLSEHTYDSKGRSLAGTGATPYFDVIDPMLVDFDVTVIPVTILGAGPAGTMTARALIELGWDSSMITVIDNSGEYGGIWRQPNVYGLSRNNPREFKFDLSSLERAPGPGEEVSRFIRELRGKGNYLKELPEPVKGRVISVQPGDLEHKVSYVTNEGTATITSPIVINALGTGVPLPISCEGKMTTSADSAQAGYRWQQVITEKIARRWQGKKLVFIGLGNSTGEMMGQIEDWRKLGIDIEYRVLTHYPRDAIRYPESTVHERGKEFRLFRDLSTPNLVDYAGDLAPLLRAYEYAVHHKRILSDVAHWDIQGTRHGGKIGIRRFNGTTEEFDFDEMFTLIGYKQPSETLRTMGIRTDNETNCAQYDYDGEFQRKPGSIGRDRVYPGYFGSGCMLQSPSNPNAIVIPGIMHRMGDLLFSLIIRAAEYQSRQLGIINSCLTFSP